MTNNHKLYSPVHEASTYILGLLCMSDFIFAKLTSEKEQKTVINKRVITACSYERRVAWSVVKIELL